ncbi:sulfatase [Candidatus Latescibacterota bacterium]
MNRRDFVHSVAALGATAIGTGTTASNAEADQKRPNIIFILTDDQRWDTMGCTGNPIIQTPSLDRLAQEGVRFSNAFVTSPACAPNRACLLTGLYERTHGFTFGSPIMKKAYSDISYPILMKKAGYRMGYVGKSHGRFEKGVTGEMFDSFVPLGRKPYLRKINGKIRHLTEIMTDKSIEFLDTCIDNQPFCLSLSFHAPHAEDDDPDQFIWPESCNGMYDDIMIPPPLYTDAFNSMPGFLKTCFNRMRWWQRFCTPDKYQRMVKGHYSMISGIDREVGRLRDELKHRGLSENTVIVFMGDNGYFLGERGFGGKFMMYEQSLRVPLIIYDPRQPASRAGKVADTTALNVDIAPTLLDLAGITPPERMQGRSLVPVLQETQNDGRGEFLCEYLSKAFPSIVQSEGYRTDRWKYIRWLDTQPEVEELYDLDTDPGEEHNLAQNSDFAAQLKDMQTRCNQAIARYESDRI